MINEILQNWGDTPEWRVQSLTAIYEIGLECIGADVHFNEENCPKWLKPKEGEGWEGVIRYEQGINAAKSESRLAWAKACGVDNG